MDETNSELESFRQQWRAEVSARARDAPKLSTAGPPKTRRPPPITSLSSSRLKPLQEHSDDDDNVETRPLEVPSSAGGDASGSSNSAGQLPETALEHYEKAVEKETQGNLGDTLALYRKAYRMDDSVDQKYKNKHFPPSSFPSKSNNLNPSNATATVLNTAHHSLDGPPQSIKQLIAGFSGLSIEPAPPAVEGTPPPPCPLAALPEEILVHIFMEVAILDVASFVRLAQVCKRMAYLVASEEQIWRRICLGSEVGFGAMHFEWQREVMGGLLIDEIPDFTDENKVQDTIERAPLSKEAITDTLLHSAYTSSWHRMFRLRPRIRFNGCYISTVNYIRPGQASVSQLTWQSPVHIVTYYRYLRFFRDGTIISLLSTVEPGEVVHHLTKELQVLHHNGAAAHLPSVFMQKALRGRWRLSTAADNPDADLNDAEGDLFVETQGASDKYLYRMKFSMRSAGKGVRNNKLVWQGFWNYNLLTDDTGEFTLRNDKAFFWSRVKSYGNGA